MAKSNLLAGDSAGPRIYRIGRIGFDQGSHDIGTQVYTGVYRTERIAPAGVGALVNFRRVAVHVLASDTYKFTVKVWVDNVRTSANDAPVQTVAISNSVGSLSEVTEEIAIEAEGSHIQIEIIVDSYDITGIFLIEGIRGHGRIARRASSRDSETE
jgi:hypothetical protein